MNTPLQLCFVWHMHQPDYRDIDGVMQMPWVFLHAIKDYYDMPWMLARHPGLKATFNITPPLIEQINLYSSSEEAIRNDRFLALWTKNPSDLHDDERDWIIKTCKSIPYDTMIKPLAPYRRLFHEESYSDRQLCDLEMWFMLAWCGVYLRRHNSLVKSLLERDEGGFECADKYELLDTLTAFVGTIFPYYAALRESGTIALATTPLNHPILPLLIDMHNATKAHPGTHIPEKPVSLEDDATLQITRAQALYHKTFGHEAVGFWPAEGAVDERTLELYRKAGLRWVATDEAILFKSLENDDRYNLYYPYQLNNVTMVFRDHGLSDLIGFTYRFWDPQNAASHFVSTLKDLIDPHTQRTVSIILDGENAWEYYNNNAFDFFDALYRTLSQSDWCQTVHMDEVITQEARSLPRLAPGSWIHGEFNTWVGHPEKTRAWELIYMTRRDFEHHRNSIDEATCEQIIDHFLASECSDWFWWYGDDHHTEFGQEFDELFRSHLLAIYDLMQVSPPSDLFVPILSLQGGASFLIKPKCPIEPSINGKYNSFFEWVGSGVIDETKLFTTMDRVRGPIDRIRFGENTKSLFCALEGDMPKLHTCDRLVIIIEPIGIRFEIPLQSLCDTPIQQIDSQGISIQIACNERLELGVTFAPSKPRTISLRMEIEQDGITIQTLPGYGELEITLGSDYSENWFI
jgi:alpha-amylase/alpha-mannosidase (GH57 family)